MKVLREDDGMRLDRWLKKHFNTSFVATQKMLRKGEVRVMGKRAKSDTLLLADQEIRIPPYLSEVPKNDAPQPWNQKTWRQWLLHEDSVLVVLNKPAGLAVQGGSGQKQSLDKMVKSDGLRLVHRLDKETSGLLLLAKTAGVARDLTAMFKKNTVHKTYWALVSGMPRFKKGKITLPLKKENEKMVPHPDGLDALTYWQVIKQKKGLSWLALSPKTGRTHQLRAHMAAMEMPIVGDKKYGGSPEKNMFLHAQEITFKHPISKIEVTYEAPPPDYMTSLLEQRF